MEEVFAAEADDTQETSIDCLTERRRVLAAASGYLEEMGSIGCRDAAARLRDRIAVIDERLGVLRIPAQDVELDLMGALRAAVEASRGRKASVARQADEGRALAVEGAAIND